MIRHPYRSGLVALALAAAGQAAAAAPPITSNDDLGTAVAAQIACAGIFVAGRAEADVLRDDIHALAPFTRTVALSVDRKAHTVTASAPGTATRTALHRPAVGCTLTTGDVPLKALNAQAARLKPLPSRPARPWPQGDAPVARLQAAAEARLDRAALDAAVRAAFDEQNTGGYPDTRAIVVVQGGTIVAEHYAPGFTQDTRMLGWSATKSLMGTLVGLLVDDGVLALDAPAPVPEWQGAGDPRAAITLRQLLTMSSGLAFVESYKPGNDSIKMLFEAGDMGALAAARPLEHAPGTHWSYSSGTTNILSRIVFQATGGTLEGMTRFAQKRLFEPAGMRSALIEPDESGVLVGSSYGYATARDWARYGLLYLNHGQAGGKRLLSPQWLDFALTPTPASERPSYGAQLWLNRPAAAEAGRKVLQDVAPDAYMAMGHNHQIVAVIPSQDAVIVRLGWTPEGQKFDWNKHLSRIAAALAPAAAAN
ncbi:serine hydrolase domain-containing protein [Stenotrophomonas rhizophila]|uniref:serine hydrolase domain-containing protein n=1 Tax=Stenotrophomonas rhizophila TaxID=216778 RepID=UPI001E2EE4BE|nr:serine hydrolase [Stenotrophomonas rhizophila]MCC7633991.1 serine hydrolase [Stenotrophomonas rhizophila]MCC7663325.1 serine hydrolase [Stenotrophomonas rhizophila]